MKAKRICSYCVQEGRDGFMGWKESKTGEDTHGVCWDCYHKQLNKLDAQRRLESGFHDTDIPAKVSAKAIITEVKSDIQKSKRI